MAYLRFNNWLPDVFLHLVNHHQQISGSKGLILDLRNNGGGEGANVYRALSVFLPRSEVIANLDYGDYKESLITIPNKRYQFPEDLPVVILIDHITACASEGFILGMKKRPATTILGTSNTMGAFADAFNFHFPSGLQLRVNCVLGKYNYPEDVFAEGRGLSPDIWAVRTHVRDLYPYEDKLLEIAKAYLR